MEELRLSAQSKEMTVNEWTLELCAALGFTSKMSWSFLRPAAYRWLVQEGYAVSQPHTDSKLVDYRPTQKGTELGLRTVENTTKDGKTRMLISCGEQGQRLLLDNVEQIMALAQEQADPLLACLTPEWRSQTWELEPASLTALVKQINSRLPDGLPFKISVTSLSDWLLWRGFLQEEVASWGQTYRVPTQAGEKFGLSLKTTSKGGKSVLYSIPAQQFILDKLGAIARDLVSGEVYRIPRRPARFVVPEEVQGRIPLSDSAISTYQLADRINIELQRINSDFEIPWKAIGNWLIKEGCLVWEKTPEQPNKLVPTQRGQAIGLCLSGKGLWLRYTWKAQQFIVDNLQKIVDFYCEHQ